VRARGLKLLYINTGTVETPSRPVRARGLKLLYINTGTVETPVAPRAGAWIETSNPSSISFQSSSRAPCGRVD